MASEAAQAAKAMLEHAFRNVGPRALKDVDFADVVSAFATFAAEQRAAGREEAAKENALLREILSFDCTGFPGMEEKAIEWANRIAGPKGQPPMLPDPVAILEMCQDIARAALPVDGGKDGA